MRARQNKYVHVEEPTDIIIECRMRRYMPPIAIQQESFSLQFCLTCIGQRRTCVVLKAVAIKLNYDALFKPNYYLLK